MTMQNLKPFAPAVVGGDFKGSLYTQGKGNYQQQYDELLLTYFPEGRADSLINSTREFVFVYTWRIWHTYVTTKGRALTDAHLAYLATVHQIITTAKTIPFEDLFTVIQVTAQVIQLIYAMEDLWGEDGPKRIRTGQYQYGTQVIDKLMDVACWFCTYGPDKLLDNKEK